MNNKSQLDAIKTINKKIDNLKAIQSQLTEFEKNFKKAFSNHEFSKKEKHMISTELASLENEIKKIASVIEKGEYLKIEEVSKVVFESWGRTKIQTNNYTIKKNLDDFENAQSVFQDELGLIFELKDLQIIEYYLKTNNRNDLYLIRVFLAPGFSFAYLDTDKVGLCIDVLSNEEFLIQLADKIENNT